VLLVALDAVATGALHLDGLADSADGFGGGRTRDDVLRIMRDHAIGAYGGVALALLIIFKVAAYQVLLSTPARLSAIVLVPVLGRWSILLLTAALPYARPSPSPASSMRGIPTIAGTAITVAATAAMQSVAPWIAVIACVIVSAAFGFYCRSRVGGITGDTLGANLQLCESAALLVLIWRP
jgi:cobalamin synthase